MNLRIDGIILWLLLPLSLASAADGVSPGRFIVDPPTLENLGFRWYIEGDDNRNASVAVSYRRPGERDWKQALPMLRVHHEVVNQDYGPYRTGNLFAGSVLFLQPGVKYEVRFVMEDPDGGAATPKTVTATTRAEPALRAGRRQVRVRPPFENLRKALDAAKPGDTLVLESGVYSTSDTVVLDKPDIALLGASEGAVIEGPGYDVDLFDIRHTDNLWFENLTLRRARMAIQGGAKGGPGASGLVVRRCRIEDVIYGINNTSENSTGWYIADNVLTGTNPTWYPRPDKTYMEPSHTGVNVYGRGHVVCYNRISRFSDAVAIANFGVPLEDVEKHPVAIDFYHNDLSFAQDDTLETDYGAHNVRVYRNRCYNAHTGLSVQPLYGGPVYLIRNELYGITALAFKLHNYCAGILAYHNTSATARTGFQSFNRWQNGHFRNNLILGGSGGYAMDTGTITPYSTLDYNGYRRGAPETFIRWYDGRERRTYASLGDFTAATGHERHGMLIDYDIFVNASPPAPGKTVDPAAYDLRLKPEAAAIDAGTRLANINDDFTGRAPDLGCYERGQAQPHYGPR
mgnify:CR=1 FL=1